jgi:hypothetical protein
MVEYWTIRNKKTGYQLNFKDFGKFELVCKVKMLDKKDSSYEVEYNGEVSKISDYFSL